MVVIPLAALVALGFAVRAIAKSPRSLGVRIGFILALVAIVCGGLALLFIGWDNAWSSPN